MAESTRTSWNRALAFLAALVGSALLAGIFNAMGFAPKPSQAGYELTHYFTPVSWPFVVAFTTLSVMLGWITNTRGPVALGMIFTLPIACSVEVSRDPTSHNLFPFEMLLTWLPAFLVAFAGAHVGRWLRDQKSRRATAEIS